MIEQLFIEVLNLSLLGSLIIIVVLMLRQLFRNYFSQTLKYALWGIVLLRLVCPFSLNSVMSIFHLLPTEQSVTVSVSEQTNFSKVQVITPTSTQVETKVPLQKEEVKAPIPIKKVLAIVWGSGALLFFISLSGCYVSILSQLRAQSTDLPLSLVPKLKRQMKLKQAVNVYQSNLVSTPLVCGIMKPMIVFPSSLDFELEVSIHHILMHEMIHLKRRDNFWKLIALFILCLHWFNPVIWVAYSKMLHDMESSCDEQVLRRCKGDGRKDYAMSLLDVARAQRNVSMMSAFVGFGESNLKKRVNDVMRYRTKRKLSVALSLGLVGVVGCSLMTNPKNSDDSLALYEEGFDGSIFEENRENVSWNETIRIESEQGTSLVSMNQVELVTDQLGSLQQALVYYVSEQNVSNKEIQSLINPMVTYEDKKLTLLSETIQQQLGVRYDISAQYGDVPMCDSSTSLAVGESQSCYLVFPFISDGEYVFNQLIIPSVQRYAGFEIMMTAQPLLDDTEVSKQQGSATREQLGRELLPAYENKFVQFIEYLEQPDAVTQSLTEFIFRTSWFRVPDIDFDSIEEADPLYLLENSIISTQMVIADELEDKTLAQAVKDGGLDYTYLVEHVRAIAVSLYGQANFEENPNDLVHRWSEELQVYYPLETEITYANPVVLTIEEDESYYKVRVVLPKYNLQGYYDEAGNVYETLEEVIKHCHVREMVIKKVNSVDKILVSHHVVK